MPIEFYLLSVFILIAFYTDVRYSKIPNVLNVVGVAVGLAYHGYQGGVTGFLHACLAAVIGFAILLILYFLKAMEAGDVKLFAAIGALTGVEYVLYCMMYAILYAGLIGVFILLFRREFMKRISRMLKYFLGVIVLRSKDSVQQIAKEDNLRFPFMYAVLPAAITTCYYFIQ